MTDGLGNLKFEESQGKWLKFKADTPIKIRVWSTNPVVHDNSYTDPKTNEVSVSTKYAFAVWNFVLGREQILDAGATITKRISELHQDDDFGADITSIDLKVMPTGELLERRYTVTPLPKATQLTPEQEKALAALDKSLDEEITNGVRASAYNDGFELPPTQIEEETDLNEIFPEN